MYQLVVIENKPFVAWKVDLSSGVKIRERSFYSDEFAEARAYVENLSIRDDPRGYWFVLTYHNREIYRPDVPLRMYPLRLVASR